MPADRPLIAQGKAVDALYVLLRGSCRVTHQRPEGGEEPAGARPNLEAEGAVDAIPELDAIGVDHDALLHSMVYLTKHHGKQRSADSLLDGRSDPALEAVGPQRFEGL